MLRLTIIAPVFEEADSIIGFHAKLRTELDRLSERYNSNILFVCDPGHDETDKRLHEIADSDPSVGVLFLSRRFGHQAALLAGLDHAKGDLVIMMDSDLQHPPEVIPQLLAEFEKGFEIVHTVRRYAIAPGFLKRFSSHFFYQVLQALSDTTIIENSADFRLISGRVCKLFQSRIRERNQFLRGLFSWVGFRQTRVNFDAPARAHGVTKYSLARMMGFAIAGITSFSKKPLRYSIYMGLAIATIGVLVAVITIIQFLLGSKFPAGWATLLSVVSLLGGAQLLGIGVLGEYIASIFDEAKARPHYLVESTRNLHD